MTQSSSELYMPVELELRVQARHLLWLMHWNLMERHETALMMIVWEGFGDEIGDTFTLFIDSNWFGLELVWNEHNMIASVNVYTWFSGETVWFFGVGRKGNISLPVQHFRIPIRKEEYDCINIIFLIVIFVSICYEMTILLSDYLALRIFSCFRPQLASLGGKLLNCRVGIHSWTELL